MAPSPAPRSSLTPQSFGNGTRTPTTPKLKAPLPPHRAAPASVLPLPSTDHPVEVVGRIREHPEGADKPSALQALQNGHTVRVRTDQGYREFALDGISLAESEDLQNFYKKYVESRIECVKVGGRCTIMMYGPTGAGKSHTMFGSAKEPGIAYRALQNILGGFNANAASEDVKCADGSPGFSVGRIRVNVTVLEVYNEDIFDLLATYPTTPTGQGWPKPNACRVRLEIMGKKAKNAVSISGSDAEKIAKEIAKVEKRRVVKSTLCNDRSSRSHCMVTLDVPSVGGRLVLVDMAGSENLEQAGLGIETKLQTGKINQGNVALKRVVEAIANGDSYIPFRDSKLTMLLQDSFEDDGAKILMILCASPDLRDMHKTIGTLEYGSKAKCIVRLPVSPAKDKSAGTEVMELSVLEARIRAMDDYISKLQQDNRMKDREKEEIDKELTQKEQDLADLRKRLENMEQERRDRCETDSKNYDDDAFRLEIERRLAECQKIADEFVEFGKRRLEEQVVEQQREIGYMHARMEEIERELGILLQTNHKQISTNMENSSKNDDEIVSKPSREALENLRARVMPMREELKVLNQAIEERKSSQPSSAFVLDEAARAATLNHNDKSNKDKERGCAHQSLQIVEQGECRQLELQATGASIADQSQPTYVSVSLGSSPVHRADKASHGLEDSWASFIRKPGNKPSFSSCLIDHDNTESNAGDKNGPSTINFNHVVHSPISETDSSQTLESSPSVISKGYFEHDESDFDDGDFDRNGWLPVIPEESEEEEERILENEEDYRKLQVRASCLGGRNKEESDNQVMEVNETVSSEVNRHFLCKGIQGWQSKEAAPEIVTGVQTEKSSQLPRSIESSFNRLTVDFEVDNKENAGTCPASEGEAAVTLTGTTDKGKGQSAAAVARRSRIENIFLLCGNRRELAASTYKHSNDPIQINSLEPRSDAGEISEDTQSAGSCVCGLETVPSIGHTTSSPKDSKASPVFGDPASIKSLGDMDISPVRSDLHIVTAKSKHPMLENIPPCGMVSSVATSFTPQTFMSPKRLSFGGPFPLPTNIGSTDIKGNRQVTGLDGEQCDVYVKWETSRDSSGKLISIIKMEKKSTLAELRKEIEPHISDMQHDFTFLMLGDPSGAPVERDTETDLQVASLPDCHKQRGSRLACLRPPLRRNLTVRPIGPLSPMENQIPFNSLNQMTSPQKPPGSCSNLKPNVRTGTLNSSLAGRTGQRLSFPLVSQVKGLRL